MSNLENKIKYYWKKIGRFKENKINLKITVPNTINIFVRKID